MKQSAILFLLGLMLFFAGCGKNDDDTEGQWENSVFIINEGPFKNGTGTVMAYDRNTGQMSGDLFEAANGRPLGNIVQSMAVYRDMVWIAVNNSNKIEVASLEDFKSVRTITDIILPRYFTFNGDTAFVSSWDSKIVMIDVNQYQVIGEMFAGQGPDEMVIAGDYLFVVNSGGLGVYNTVSYVNIKNLEDHGEILVADRPCSILKDKNNKLWVLCSGQGWNGFPNPDTDTPGELLGINPRTREITERIQFPDAVSHPDQLIMNGDGTMLYYSFPGGIFKVDPQDPVLSGLPFIASDIMYYGLGYDAATDFIYASDPLDYAQNGYIFRFRHTDGSLVDSFAAGIVPNGFWFND